MGFFVGLVLLASLLAVLAADDTRPNIVLIIADDLGFNDVSFRGSNQIQTPNIDALAYSGVILNRHYVLPTCTPSRTAILTGLYPIRTGMQGYPLKAGEPRGLPLRLRTLPQHLKRLGYRTNLVGKWHQGCYETAFTPTHRGFDHHLGYWNGYMSYFSHSVHMDSPHGLEEGRIGHDLHWDARDAWELRGEYATRLFTRRAREIIAAHEPSAGPLFLQVAHLAAHAGLNGTRLEVPDAAHNDAQHAHIADAGRRALAGVITELDASVGAVVRALDERGILNNTLIVFMADNGGETEGPHRNFASNWPLRGQKWTLYEGGVRGVAAVWSPRLANPSTVVQRTLVHATDWLPTFYEAAGGDLADLGDVDGHSQWGALTRADVDARTEVLVNVDNASAIIQRHSGGLFKLVKGQQSADRSVFLGDSGEAAPAYDVAAVLRSEAAQALARHAAGDAPPLTEALVEDVRAEARYGLRARCRQGGGPAVDLACEPYCLFELELDPCETRDRADDAALDGVVAELRARLAHWEAVAVPQINQPVDDAADPRRHNMTWVPWRDPPKDGVVDPQPSGTAATGTAASPPAVLPVVLALLPAIAWSRLTCAARSGRMAE